MTELTAPIDACPHCKRIYSIGQIAKHLRVCPDDPARRAAIVAALTHPDRPGLAVTFRVYDKCRAADAPSATTLQRNYGAWSQVCAHFGLSSDTPCPHCERVIGNMAQHEPVCPARPDKRAAILAVLADPDDPGYAVSAYAYEQLAAGSAGLPSRQALRDAFGDWPRVARHFGLVWMDQAAREAELMDEIARACRVNREALDAARDYHGHEICSAVELPDGRLRCVLR